MSTQSCLERRVLTMYRVAVSGSLVQWKRFFPTKEADGGSSPSRPTIQGALSPWTPYRDGVFMVRNNSANVSRWRQKAKAKLVKHHGGKCLDCGYQGPPFMYDFDHRDPATKLFGLGEKGATKAYDKMLEESMKCDLVCANCHRFRTHKQRCLGCEYCNNPI